MTTGTATRRVYRLTVPVDDRWHTHDLTGPVLHVATRQPDMVEIWVMHTDDGPATAREFRVYGTGHPIVEPCRHVGSAFAAGGALVWHLMERA